MREDSEAEGSQHTGKTLTPLLQGCGDWGGGTYCRANHYSPLPYSSLGINGRWEKTRRMGKVCAQTPPLSLPEASAEEGR